MPVKSFGVKLNNRRVIGGLMADGSTLWRFKRLTPERAIACEKIRLSQEAVAAMFAIMDKLDTPHSPICVEADGGESPPACSDYLREAMDYIIDQIGWADKFPRECHDRMRKVCEAVKRAEPLPFKPNATITGGDSRPVHGLVGETNQEDRT